MCEHLCACVVDSSALQLQAYICACFLSLDSQCFRIALIYLMIRHNTQHFAAPYAASLHASLSVRLYTWAQHCLKQKQNRPQLQFQFHRQAINSTAQKVNATSSSINYFLWPNSLKSCADSSTKQHHVGLNSVTLRAPRWSSRHQNWISRLDKQHEQFQLPYVNRHFKFSKFNNFFNWRDFIHSAVIEIPSKSCSWRMAKHGRPV